MTKKITPITRKITFADRWDHFLARVRWRRNHHRIEPNLYALGEPNQDSPVFVTANYKLSFDSLRSALDGINGYIMVLDTRGINVWCAAGKGTFGTEELVHRIESTCLKDVVRHRVLILPQLGASGVSAHEVKRRSKFKVEYGPVRAADLPEYLKNHSATPEMRQVRFNLFDRLILIPVEVTGILPILLIIGLIHFLTGRGFWAYEAVAAILAGVVLFPILLPWIPNADFSAKGFILGGVTALPFILIKIFSSGSDSTIYKVIGSVLIRILIIPSVVAFIALNFTGATPNTSRTGVRREIFKYIPIMAAMFGTGIIIAGVLKLIH